MYAKFLTLVLGLSFTWISPAASQDSVPTQEERVADEPQAQEEDDIGESEGFGSRGIGGLDGGGMGGLGMGEIQNAPAGFMFDGLRLPLPPERVTQLSEASAVLSDEISALNLQLEQLRSELESKQSEYRSQIESQLTADELNQLTQLRLKPLGSPNFNEPIKKFLDAVLLQFGDDLTQIQILEGVSRSATQKELRTLSRQNKLSMHAGYQFYVEPLNPTSHQLAQVVSICLDANHFQIYGGPKFCGGFHPDLRIVDTNAEETTEMLICFTCHEVRILRAGQSLIFDLSSDAIKRLEPLAKALYRHRTPLSGRVQNAEETSERH